MYKVFVNDKPLFLTNEVQKETDFKLFLLESVDIKKLIVKIFQHKIQPLYPSPRAIVLFLMHLRDFRFVHIQ